MSSSNTMDMFLINEDKLWFNGNVFFYFEEYPKQDGTWGPMFSPKQEEMVRNAMKQIVKQVPCINFM